MLLERAVPTAELQIRPPFVAVAVVLGLALVPLERVERVAAVVADPAEGLLPALDFGREVDFALGEMLCLRSHCQTGVAGLLQLRFAH